MTVTIHTGDCRDVMRTLPEKSVHTCISSPPYFGLRDYGADGQYGLEDSPSEYVDTMRTLFAELRRALADDGTLWLNLGDSYYSGRGNPGPNSADEKNPARRGWVRPQDRCGVGWSSPKNLLGIPWRVAFALQDDGWILRNANIWHKPNAMPESVTDRLSNRYEHVFMFTKSSRYWFDLDPIRMVTTTKSPAALNWARDTKEAVAPGQRSKQHRTERGAGKADGTNLAPVGHRHTSQDPRGRNPGDVWSIPTTPFAAAHFAVMPVTLAQICVLSGCKPDGTVLDPFSGSGTTGFAAQRAGRRYVGIDINAEYLNLSLAHPDRLQGATIDFGDAS